MIMRIKAKKGALKIQALRTVCIGRGTTTSNSARQGTAERINCADLMSFRWADFWGKSP
jgi:hypothetical protein